MLRDELITKREHNNLLETYLLKVALLKKSPDRKPIRNVGECAVDVLTEIEEKGAKHNLEDPFIKDKSVLHESDKSYLESKRILMHLIEESDTFRGDGVMHSIILIGIFLMTIVIAIVSGWFYFYKIDNRKTTSNEKCVMTNQEYMKYSFILQAFLFFMMAWTVIGGVIYTVQTVCLKRRLYQMFKYGPLIVYVLVFVFLVILVITQQFTIANVMRTITVEDGIKIECKWTTYANKLSGVLFIVSLVFVGIFICYVVLFPVCYRVRMEKHVRSPFDFFFCDDVCGIHKIVYPKPRVISV